MGLICYFPNSFRLVANMKAELQEVMNMLRKLQGAIDFGNAPMAEREELAGDVADIMDAHPDNEPVVTDLVTVFHMQ